MPILKEITVKNFEAEAMSHFNDIFCTKLRNLDFILGVITETLSE